MKIRSLFCLALLSSASYTAEPFNFDDLRGMRPSQQQRVLSEFLRRHNRAVPNLGVNHLIPLVQEINVGLQQRQGMHQQQQVPLQQQQLLAPQIIQQNVQPVQVPVIPVAVNDAPRNQGGGNRQRLIQAQRRQQQEDLNEEIEDLRNQLQTAQQGRQALRQQFQQALQTQQQQLTGTRNQEVANVRNQLQAAEQERDQAREEVQTLRQQNQQALTQVQQQLIQARQASNEQSERFETRIRELEEAERRAQQAMAVQQRQLEAARQAPNEQIDILQTRIQQLEEAAQQTVQEQQRQLEAARQAPNEQIARLEARIRELEETAQQAAQEQQRQLEAARQAPNEQIARLETRIQELEEAERRAQQTAQEQQRELEAARQTPNEQIGRLEARIQELEETERRAQHTAQEQQQQFNQHFNEAVNPLRERVAELETFNTERQTRLDEVNLENQELTRQLLELGKSSTSAQAAIDEKVALDMVNQLLISKQSETDNYREKVVALEKQINDLQEKHNLTAVLLETARKNVSDEEKKNPTKKKSKEAHDRRLKGLREKVEDLEVVEARQSTELKQLQKQREDLDDQFDSQIETFAPIALQFEGLYELLEKALGKSRVSEQQERELDSTTARGTASSSASGAPKIGRGTSTSSSSMSSTTSSSSMMPPPPPPPLSGMLNGMGSKPKALSPSKAPTSASTSSSQAKVDKKGKGKADPEAEQETLTVVSYQSRGNIAILEQIKEHRRTSTLTSDEIDLLHKIEKEILEGDFNPKFTLSPRRKAPSTDSSNTLIKLKEIMEQRRKSLADSLEYDGMDGFSDDEATAEVISSSPSRLDPAFKAKLKRLREMYRRAIPDLDPARNWTGKVWLIWEYKNYRDAEQRKKIDAQVDQYIEKHADALKEEFVDLDVSNPQINEAQNKLVAQNGHMTMSITQNQ